MGKRKKRDPPPKFASAKAGHEHFTPMYDSLLNSPAYIVLSPVAKVIYQILRQEFKGAYTGNSVKCPYSTIVEKGVSRNSIYGGILMLEALGFITYESGGIGHQPSIYHFSDKWQLIKTKEEAKQIKNDLKAQRAEIKERRHMHELIYSAE